MSDELRGDALQERARELDIPGRSEMTADELRAAVVGADGDALEPAAPVDKHLQFELRVENPADREAILVIDGEEHRLSQSDIADLRKALDRAFLEVS